MKSIILATLAGLFTFLFRWLFVHFLTSPLEYHRWLPARFDDRARAFVTGQDMFMIDAWGVYYIILGLKYKLFDFLGIPESGWIESAILLNIVISSLSAILIFLIASRLFGLVVATVSVTLYAIYIPGLFFNTITVAETFYEFLLILFLFFVLQKNIIWLRAVLLGLILGMIVVTRTIALPFLVLSLIWLSWKLYLQKKSFWYAKVAVVTLLIVLPVLVFGMTNKSFNQRNSFSLSSSLGANLVLTYCELRRVDFQHQDGSFWFSPPVMWGTPRPAVQHDEPFYNTRFYAQKAWSCIGENPQVFVFNLANINNVFDSKFYPYPTENSFWQFENLLILSKVWLWISLALFMFYPLLNRSQNTKVDIKSYSLFYALVASLLFSVYLANPGEERYIVPYAWVLMMYAVASIRNLLTTSSSNVKSSTTTSSATTSS